MIPVLLWDNTLKGNRCHLVEDLPRVGRELLPLSQLELMNFQVRKDVSGINSPRGMKGNAVCSV